MLLAQKIYGAGHKLVSEDYEILPMPRNTVLVQEIDYATAEASLSEEECFQSALDNQDIEELRWCYEFFYGLNLDDDDLIVYHNRRQHCAKIATKSECAGLLPPAPKSDTPNAGEAQAYIGVKQEDGTIKAILVGYNGGLRSPNGADWMESGPTLFKHYQSTEKANALIEIGDIGFLHKTLEETTTTRYGWQAEMHFSTGEWNDMFLFRDDEDTYGQPEFLYLWANNEWQVMSYDNRYPRTLGLALREQQYSAD